MGNLFYLDHIRSYPEFASLQTLDKISFILSRVLFGPLDVGLGFLNVFDFYVDLDKLNGHVYLLMESLPKVGCMHFSAKSFQLITSMPQLRKNIT